MYNDLKHKTLFMLFNVTDEIWEEGLPMMNTSQQIFFINVFWAIYNIHQFYNNI